MKAKDERPRSPDARPPEWSPGGGTDSISAARRGPRWTDPLIFLALVAGALIVRLLYLEQARSVVFFDLLISDGRAYDEWARRIVAGDWLGRDVFYQAPLYPYFLALVRLAVGDDPWRIRAVQMALGAVSCGLLFLAGRTFFSRRVGAIAGLILTLYPPAIFFDGLIQKAGLANLWMTFLLYVLARTQRTPKVTRWAGAGLILGLLILTRENALLLVPLLAVWLAVHFAGRAASLRLAWLAGFVGGLAVVLLPVGFRNLLVGGQFALTTAQAGPNFYIGNNPDSNGSYTPLRPGRSDTPVERQDATELAEEALGRKLTPREVSRYWFGRAWAFIRDQPGAWLGLMFRKCRLVINAYEVPDAEDLYFYEQYCPFLRRLGAVGHFGVLCPLAVAGVALTWHRRRELWLLYALLLAIASGVAVFFVFARYRFPMVGVLCLFAAAAVAEVVPAVRAAHLPRLTAAILASLLAAVAVNWPMYSEKDQQAASHSNAGAALAAGGKLEQAVEQYQRALELEPELADTHFNLGNALLRLGRVKEAVASFQTAVSLRPDDPEFLLNLGTLLAEQGDLPAAARHLSTALRIWPDSPDVANNLGLVLMQLGQWSRAVDTLRSGLQASPEHLGLAGNLAWALATCPDAGLRDGAAAVRLAEHVCRATGYEDARGLDVLAAAYAEVGRLEEAVTVGRRAMQMASQRGAGGFARQIGARVERYQAGQPFHYPP